MMQIQRLSLIKTSVIQIFTYSILGIKCVCLKNVNCKFCAIFPHNSIAEESLNADLNELCLSVAAQYVLLFLVLVVMPTFF